MCLIDINKSIFSVTEEDPFSFTSVQSLPKPLMVFLMKTSLAFQDDHVEVKSVTSCPEVNSDFFLGDKVLCGSPAMNFTEDLTIGF